MLEPTDLSFSFRTQLREWIADFLAAEGLKCAQTSSAFATIVSELSEYREEGIYVSPEVYVCSDINALLRTIPGTRIVQIGEGPQTDDTARKALKECATLAAGSWGLFFERSGTKFRYGVFATTDLPLSLRPHESIAGAVAGKHFAVFAQKMAHGYVELLGGRSNRCRIFFSDASIETSSPINDVEDFAKAATSRVAIEYREPTCRFLFRSLAEIIRRSHGSLTIVTRSLRRRLPTQMSDAIVLDPPYSIASDVRSFLNDGTLHAMANLQSTATFLEALMANDGIVVFRSDGTVLAYRAFFSSRETLRVRTLGGARRRAFEAIKNSKSNNIAAALFHSQDGVTEYYELEIS